MPLVVTLSISEEGFGYQWHSENGIVKNLGFIIWSNIESIDAYKRDLFTYDQICIDLHSTVVNGPLEIDEEDPNWEPLMAAFSQYLPDTKPWPDWFPEVAFPAFASNPRNIFQQKN